MSEPIINKTGQRDKSKNHLGELWLQIVQYRVSSIPFGEIQIVIQDSRVIQIGATEKLRLDHPQQSYQSPTGGGRPQQYRR